MHYPAPTHSLFAQLQSRFPASTLVTELVQIQAGQYVVRALVQAGGTVLTTAMAAAPTIEQAEDRARARVLAVLGITLGTAGSDGSEIPPLLHGLNSSKQPFETESRFSLPSPTSLTADAKQEEQPPLPTYKPLATLSHLSTGEDLSFPNEVAEDVEEVPEEFGEVYDGSDPYDVEDHVEEIAPPMPEPSLLSVPTEMGSKSLSDRPAPSKPAKSEPAIAPVPAEPEDLSSLIALTDIEMDRIGWTKQEGRDYLKRTYRKSTRQKLEVDELMDFLNYLKALPSANGL